MMERSRVKEVNLTTEEAIKLLMSMGIIQPTERLPPPEALVALDAQGPALKPVAGPYPAESSLTAASRSKR